MRNFLLFFFCFLSLVSKHIVQSTTFSNSVRPFRQTTRHVVLYLNEYVTYVAKFFPPPDSGMILNFLALPPLKNSKGNSISAGRYKVGKICDSEIAVYLRNGTR